MGRPHNYLVISGGGGDGAYGAGLLTGWTATGTRPEFQIVTGISTGALIAPFAFLGSEYDRVLREVYTRLSKSALYPGEEFPAFWLGLLAKNAARFLRWV